MKRSRKPKIILTMLALLLTAVAIFIFYMVRPGQQAKNTVAEFYTYEQQAQFAESWELFHTQMKDKFTKGDYIQDRAQGFMNNFGVDTFSFAIGDLKNLEEWTMEKGAKPLKGVHVVTVVQTYKGKYGHFRLHQDVFVTEEKGEWKVLWNYHK